MMFAAKGIGQFGDAHPRIVILVGVVLVGEGWDMRYIYFAMGFSLVIEMLNIHVRKKHVTLVTHHGPRLTAPRYEQN